MSANEELQHDEGGGHQAYLPRPPPLHGLPLQVCGVLVLVSCHSLSPPVSCASVNLSHVFCLLSPSLSCSPRLTRPPVAQLARLHVVTPKAPTWATVNPQVPSELLSPHTPPAHLHPVQVQPFPGVLVFVTSWETRRGKPAPCTILHASPLYTIHHSPNNIVDQTVQRHTSCTIHQT